MLKFLKMFKPVTFLFYFLVVFIVLLANAEENIKNENKENFLNRLIATSNYNKDDFPPLINSLLQINVTIGIINVKTLPEVQEV